MDWAIRRGALLHLVHAVLCSVELRRGVHRLRNVARCAVSADTWSAQCHGERLLIETVQLIHLLTLQFVLNAFSVWHIANQGKDRSSVFDEKCALVGFGVVESGLRLVTNLYTVVTIRVAEKLLQTRTIQELFD